MTKPKEAEGGGVRGGRHGRRGWTVSGEKAYGERRASTRTCVSGACEGGKRRESARSDNDWERAGQSARCASQAPVERARGAEEGTTTRQAALPPHAPRAERMGTAGWATRAEARAEGRGLKR